MLFPCLAYSSNLKMEATCSSETSVDFQRTARRYIPEDKTLKWRWELIGDILLKFSAAVFIRIFCARLPPKITTEIRSGMNRFHLITCIILT
jgi:hypothetical protein